MWRLLPIILATWILAGCQGNYDKNASATADEAKESALQSELGTVRIQIELFKVQHLEKAPQDIPSVGVNSAKFINIFRSRTNTKGDILPVQGNRADYPYGPYMQEFPANPFIEGVGNDPKGVSFGTCDPAPGDGRTGWYLNITTGKFSANDDKSKHPAHVTY
jgi:hypothetical protein